MIPDATLVNNFQHVAGTLPDSSSLPDEANSQYR